MEQHDQQPGAPRQQPVTLTRVSAKEFAAKFKSKRECYDFLAGECECYLPPYGKCQPLTQLNRHFQQTT